MQVQYIHPMLVHFPIVLLLLAVALDVVIVGRGGDLAARRCVSGTALAMLVLGAVAAAVAAMFGDMALDVARAHGFPAPPLERHADLGITTMVFFSVLALARLFAWWRRIPLAGGRGWGLVVLGLVGVGILITTAWFGGELVYHIGVNVEPVTP